MNKLIEIKRLSTLFKYVSDAHEVVDGIFRDHKIRFTQPAALNDPLEFNPTIRYKSEGDNYKGYKYNDVSMPSRHFWEHINLIEARINKFGILSLTDNPFSFEMWCRYANGHRGFLIEFNIPDKIKPTLQLTEGVNLKVHKVRYVKDYEINLDRLGGTDGVIPPHKIRDAIFLRKTKHWKSEREYRIIRQLIECDTYKPPAQRTSHRDNDGQYLFPLSLSCICNIIFGVNTTGQVKRNIIEYCKGTKINFLQTVVYKDLQNKIDFVPIDRFETIDKYVKMLPQIFVQDSIMEKYNGKYIYINSLSELPYYHLQPNCWEEYYKKKLNNRNTTGTE